MRRLPPSRPGRGTAQLYVADMQAPTTGGASEPQPSAPTPVTHAYRGPMTKRFDGREVGPSAAPSAPSADGGDEAARIAAMFQATTEQWDETQERMAQYVPNLTQRNLSRAHRHAAARAAPARRPAVYRAGSGAPAAPSGLYLLPLWPKRALDPRVSYERQPGL